MKKSFDKFFQELIVAEGGVVNDPDDRGGLTNLGITFGAYKNWINCKGEWPDEEEVAFRLINIEPEEAKVFYRELYWDKVKGDLLPAGLDIFVADTAVNMGVHAAGVQLQEVLKLKADGIIGSKTIAAANDESIIPGRVLQQLYCRRHSAYFIIGQIGNNKKFVKGWNNRINHLYNDLLGMI